MAKKKKFLVPSGNLLFRRIVGDRTFDGTKLPVLQLCAMLHEYRRGEVSRNDVIDYFDLRNDTKDLDVILRKIDQLAADRKKDFVDMVGDIMLLSERNIVYSSQKSFFDRIKKFS